MFLEMLAAENLLIPVNHCPLCVSMALRILGESDCHYLIQARGVGFSKPVLAHVERLPCLSKWYLM